MNERVSSNERPASERYHVEALARGLSVLSLFSGETRWLSLSDIARRTGLNISTALRLVRTLQASGFLEQSPDCKSYGLATGAPRWTTLEVAQRNGHVGGLPLELQVLNAFTEDHPTWSAGDLARHHGLDEATTARLLSTLVEHGYLETDEQGDVYRVGLRPVALAYAALTHLSVRIHALPILVDLLEATDLDTTLAVRSGTGAIYIVRLNAPEVWKGHSSVGRAVPLHCTAVGKLLLAYLPAEELDRILEETGLSRFTETTIADRSALERELAQIRTADLALDNEEWMPGRGCLAAPIRDASGRVIAALGASGPVSRILAEQETLSRLVRDAANRVSYTLGYLRAYY